MSKLWVSDIAEMHRYFEFHDGLVFTGDFLRFRQRFLEEELEEFDDAITEGDPEKAVDALIDLCVVAIGTLDLAKVDVDKAWQVVHLANMAKQRKENPTRRDSGGFDLAKPEGWVPPSHKGNTGLFDAAIQGIHSRAIGFKKKDSPVPSHIKTLDGYRDHAMSKTHDYDDDTDPEFFHSTYYPGGISDIMYEISKKVKRIRRGLKRMMNGGGPPKTDSLHDSFRDISIYSAIGDTYMKGDLEGQTSERDMFNREVPQR